MAIDSTMVEVIATSGSRASWIRHTLGAMEVAAGRGAGRVLERTPASQMLVVSANLQAGAAGPAPPVQIQRFARRLRRLLPFAPDVLLLQEVTDETAGMTAEFLAEEIPFSFSVERSPGPPPETELDQSVVEPAPPEDRQEEVVSDTAVVVNAGTTRVRDPGGDVMTSYDVIDASPGAPWRTKRNAYLVAAKRGRRFKVALISIHFVGNWRLEPQSIGYFYKNQWTREITAFLEERYPSSEYLHVIGGDFNHRRCIEVPERVDCEEWPFWHTLVKRVGLRDSIFEIHGTSDEGLEKQRKGKRRERKRIDYIFTNARVIDASHDAAYDASAGDRGFYSDHALLWALINTRRGRSEE
jgi:endonuclease/exonuclease/phosphatase family metal-dependent hydrolase